MAHWTILHTSHLLLIRILPRVKLTRVGHKGGRIHHSTGRVGIVHVREAVSIVVGDGVVHPGAHGDGPDRLCATTLAISRLTARNPLKGAGTDDDGAVSRPRRVVMDRSSRVAGWWRIVCGVRCVCGVGWEMNRQDGGRLQGQSQKPGGDGQSLERDSDEWANEREPETETDTRKAQMLGRAGKAKARQKQLGTGVATADGSRRRTGLSQSQ